MVEKKSLYLVGGLVTAVAALIIVIVLIAKSGSDSPISSSRPVKESKGDSVGKESSQYLNASGQSINQSGPNNSSRPVKGSVGDSSRKVSSRDLSVSGTEKNESALVKSFKSAKSDYLEYLKKAVMEERDSKELEEGFNLMMRKFDKARREDRAFVDTEEPVCSSIFLNDFVRSAFKSQLEETIQEYDKRLKETCKSNGDEFKALFKAFLDWSWKYTVFGRTSPDWITFTNFSQAEKWCAKRTPASHSEQEAFPHSEQEASPSAERDAATLSEKEKFVVEASQMFIEKKVKLDSLLKGTSASTSEKLIAEIQKAKTFEDISKSIMSVLKHSKDTSDANANQELYKELVGTHLKIFARFLEINNEDPNIVNAMNSLADNASGSKKLTSFECAEAWGAVIMNVKNFELVESYYREIDWYNISSIICSYNHFPKELFSSVSIDKLKLLRGKHRDKTALLLSARNTKEVLQSVTKMEFESQEARDLSNYFKAVSLLFYDHSNSLFSRLCPNGIVSSLYLDAKELLLHIKAVVNRTATMIPQKLVSHLSWTEMKNFMQIPKEIARHLQAEKESVLELQKWAEFAVDYEFIVATGLENNESNKEYFDAYRALKADFTKDNLSAFLELFLKKSKEFASNGRVENVIRYVSGMESSLHVKRVACALWKCRNAERVATNIMNIYNKDSSLMIDYFVYDCFNFPFLLGTLDDDFITYGGSFLGVRLPMNYNFKQTLQFKKFLTALRTLLSIFTDSKWVHYEYTRNLDFNMKVSPSKFAPSIGFLKPELKKYLQNEVAAIISAYKDLISVVDDKDIQALMRAEVSTIENDFNNQKVD